MTTRRDLLRAATAIGAGLCARISHAGQAVLQPARALRALGELAIQRSAEHEVSAMLTAKPSWVEFSGRRMRAMTYNDSVPGPLIRLRAGDHVRLHFDNQLTESTNLHFHGLFLPPTGRADNVWIHVAPRESFDYEFTLAAADQGLYWYHPHIHQHHAGGAVSASAQLFAGLAGPILVEGDVDRIPELAAAEDHVLVLKDFDLRREHPTAHTPDDWMLGKEGPVVTVNGQIEPTLSLTEPLARLRLLNAANARFFSLAFDDAREFFLIATDGHFLQAPVALKEYLLVPGARAEILLPITRPDSFRLLNRPYVRGGRSGELARTLLHIAPGRHQPDVALPQRLDTIEAFDETKVVRTRPIVLSELMIDGRFFNPARVDATVKVDSSEIWQVTNLGSMDHPFHVHTWSFQVLTRNGRPEPFRAQRDMINIRTGDTLRLGIHFREHVGKSLYHCHISEHGDRSMMAIVESVP